MKYSLPLVAATVLAVSMPGADAFAKGKPDNAGGQGRGQVHAPAARGCPPGLAKKNPPCVPPGLAKKGVVNGVGRDNDDYFDDGFVDADRRFTRIVDRHGRVIAVGDVVDDGFDRYVILPEPDHYGLPPLTDDEVYLQVGEVALRLDRDTQRVLTIIALGDLLTR